MKIKRPCGLKLNGMDLQVCYTRMQENPDCSINCFFLKREKEIEKESETE